MDLNRRRLFKTGLTLAGGSLLASTLGAECTRQNTDSSNLSKPFFPLIVYLSRTNNTKAIATIIQNNVGGPSVPLELEKPYPENYPATVQQVVEENETRYLPPLRTTIDSIEKYDVVFIGFPTWGMKMPPPMKSFLTKYKLSGKRVIPFNTNAGYGVGTGFETVKELCPDSKILEGFEMKGGVERDGIYLDIKGVRAIEAENMVKKWLQRINLTKGA